MTSIETHMGNSSPSESTLRAKTPSAVQSPDLMRKVLWFLVAAIVIVGAVIGIYQLRQKKILAAQDALYRAQQAYEEEAKKLAPPAPKPADDPTADKKSGPETQESGLFKKLDVAQNFPKTVQAYTQVIASYGGTSVGFQAKLALGNLYLDHGDSAQAGSYFSAAIDSAPSNLEKSSALANYAYSLENQGKHPDALQSIERALNLGESSFKGDLLMAQARNFEAIKEFAKAKASYDRVIAELPSSPLSQAAELQKAQLK